MTTEQDIREIEIDINQAEALVRTKQQMESLISNKAFTDIVEKGYFENEASRLVLLKADPNTQDDSQQKDIMNRINAIGYLRQYFIGVMQRGRMAENSLEDHKKTREEMLAENMES